MARYLRMMQRGRERGRGIKKVKEIENSHVLIKLIKRFIIREVITVIVWMFRLKRET